MFECPLLQGDTPSSDTNTCQCFQNKPGESKETVDSNRPEPEKILHVCQIQVAELELWLDKTKVSLESETQSPEMQQMVEQQLADCQVRLSGQSSLLPAKPITLPPIGVFA